jgi:uncharacterized protein (DUF1501 family)
VPTTYPHHDAVSYELTVGTSLCPPYGLKQANLYEARDLAPTTDLRAVIKGVLHEHPGVSERTLAEAMFPDSADVKAARGLLG